MSFWSVVGAVAGGVGGFFVGGPAGAAIGAGLGGSLGASADSSNAVGKAGEAQAGAAYAQLAQAKEIEAKSRADRREAYDIASSAAQPSAAELSRIDGLIQKSEASLAQQLKIIEQGQATLESVDAATKEAGAQTLKLLQGQEAQILSPLKEARTKQRSDLEQRLASKLGPGYKTTAAGIMALNGFDSESSSIFTNAQFQAFTQVVNATSTLGGLSGNLRSQAASQTGNAFAQSVNIDQAFINALDATKARKLQAAGILVQSPVNYGASQAASQTLTNVIGNQYAGQIAQAQSMGNLFGNLGQIGLTSYLGGGGGGGAAPAAASANGFVGGSANPYNSYAPVPTFGQYMGS